MIESARFTNVSGDFIDFNAYSEQYGAVLPMTQLTTEVPYRTNEQEKALEHGIWPAYTYMGSRIIRAEGDAFKDSAAEFNQLRLLMYKALIPKPQYGKKRIGTLEIVYTGIVDVLQTDCTIDGYPEMPIDGLSPARSKFLVIFKSFDPRLYSKVEQITEVSAATGTFGRTYPKSYPKSYGSNPLAIGDAIITNAGNVETPFRVRFTGPVDSPQITLTRPGEPTRVVWLNGLTIGAGHWAEIDLGARTAFDDGGSNIYYYTAGSQWFHLEPGNNPIRFGSFGVAAPASCTYYWRNAYMV